MTYKEVYKRLRCGNQVYLKGTDKTNKLFVVESIKPIHKEATDTYIFEIVVQDATGQYYNITHKDILRIVR